MPLQSILITNAIAACRQPNCASIQLVSIHLVIQSQIAASLVRSKPLVFCVTPPLRLAHHESMVTCVYNGCVKISWIILPRLLFSAAFRTWFEVIFHGQFWDWRVVPLIYYGWNGWDVHRSYLRWAVAWVKSLHLLCSLRSIFLVWFLVPVLPRLQENMSTTTAYIRSSCNNCLLRNIINGEKLDLWLGVASSCLTFVDFSHLTIICYPSPLPLKYTDWAFGNRGLPTAQSLAPSYKMLLTHFIKRQGVSLIINPSSYWLNKLNAKQPCHNESECQPHWVFLITSFDSLISASFKHVSFRWRRGFVLNLIVTVFMSDD